MANFTDCADNLTCATLSGSNGIGVGLVAGTPNKIVVSASNVPNSALANNSININGTTIALGATGSLAIGDITAVTAGTNLTGGGTSGSLTVSLTSSITGGLTNISGLTTLSSSQISGTFSGSLLGTASYATLAGTAATASYVATGSAIATFTNDVRNQFSAGSNIGISSGVISLSSSVSTTALSGTTGVSGALGLFTNLTGTNISGSRITGSFTGSAGGLYNLTASGISNFTNDVRAQFSAGTNITINNGVISASAGGGGGSGTINTGSAGYVTYYPSAGTTVDDASGSTGGLYWDNSNIRLGINTASPGAKLEILASGTTNDASPEFRISGSNGKIDFYNSLPNDGYNPIVETGDKAIIFTEGTQDTGDFVIAPWVSTGAKGIRVTSNGDVGIGVSAPSTTLHVNGNISGTYLAVSDNTTTTGQNELYGKNIPKAWGKFKLSNPIVLADGYNFVTNRYNWITTGQKIAISASNFTTSAMVLSASIQAYITYENNTALVAGTANAVPRVISTTSNGSEGIITIDFINHTSSLLTMTSSPYSDAVPYLNVTIFTKM